MLLFGGTIFGWYSLVYVLKKDGIFSQLCRETNTSHYLNNKSEYPANGSMLHTETVGCAEQDSMLASVYTVTSAVFGIISFPMGWIFDMLGLRITRLGARYERYKFYIVNDI